MHSGKQVFYRTMFITIFFSFLHFLSLFYGWQWRVCLVRWDTPNCHIWLDRQENRFFLMKKNRHSYFKISWALILGRNFLFHRTATGSANDQDLWQLDILHLIHFKLKNPMWRCALKLMTIVCPAVYLTICNAIKEDQINTGITSVTTDNVKHLLYHLSFL